MKPPHSKDATRLQRAEDRLRALASAIESPQSIAELKRLTHELTVHQIESEIQNEALQRARDATEALAAQYLDLYDSAPVSFLSFDRTGRILWVNLTATRLLGVAREHLVTRPFRTFVREGERAAFSNFLQHAFASSAKARCDLVLAIEGSHGLRVRIEGTRSQDTQECRAVIVDIGELIEAQRQFHAIQTETQNMLALSERSRLALLSVTEDIQATSAALRASEARTRSVFEQANDGIYVISADNRYLDVNPRGLDLLGYTRAELLTMRMTDVLAPHEVGRLAIEHPDMMNGMPHIAEWAHVRRDGSIFIGEVSARRLDDRAYLAIVRDLTERKQAEMEILRGNAELNGLNALGRRVSKSITLNEVVSTAIEEMVAVTQADVAFIFLCEGDQLVFAGMGPASEASRARAIPENRVGACVSMLSELQASPIYARDVFTDLRCDFDECKLSGYRSFAALPLLADAQMIGVVGIACAVERDFGVQAAFLETLSTQLSSSIHNAQLHEKIQQHAADLEQRIVARTAELARAMQVAEAADRTKSTFLATMSHELRTPLNSIIGFTGILLQELAGPLNAEQKKQLGMVQASGRHLLVLINDVLDLSKIEANALAVEVMPFDLAASLRKVAATILPLADKKGLTLSVGIDDGLGEMLGDVRRVEQILLNLLANAIKFTESGTITLRAERLADYHSSADAAPGAALRMSVTDTGIGILPENLQQLFIPFRQIESHIARQHDGTGLGLAISARLAALMGGKIEASSHVGRGSTFTVTLPLHPPHLGDSV